MVKTTGRTRLGFTLAEMMITAGCGSMILAAAVAAGVALQRSFAGVETNSVSQANQLRVLDYIAMDARRATNVSVPNDLSYVTFTVPDYYLNNPLASPAPSASATAAPSNPKWDSTNKVVYYDGSNSAGGNYQNAIHYTIKYCKDPNDSSRLNRIVTNSGTNASTTTTIATNVASFRIMQPAQQQGTARFTASVTFYPIFTRTSRTPNWTSGAAPPTNNDGSVDGDYYVDQSPVPDPNDNTKISYYKNDVYVKSNGVYSSDSNTAYCNIFLRNPGAR